MSGFKTGNIVVCVTNKGFGDDVTIGNQYIVQACSHCSKTIKIENDKGMKIYMGAHHFRKI